MAINFPATGGQATDGSFTYTVAGIVYAWNGSSWQAAGAGASATDRSLFSVTTNSANATPALSYDNNTGVFSYTPPLPESDTLQSVITRGGTVTSGNPSFGTDVFFTGTGTGAGNGGAPYILWDKTNNNLLFSDDTKITLGYNGDLKLYHFTAGSGTNYISAFNNTEIVVSSDVVNLMNQNHSAWYFKGDSSASILYHNNTPRLTTTGSGVTVSGALTAGGLTYPTTNGNSGQSLVSDGAGNVTWVTAAGLSSRTTASNTSSLANDAVANVSITTPKTYVLMKVQTSHAAWVTLYSDSTSRTADASRQISVDPIPGSGVVAEVITTGAQTQLITPGAICFNSAATGITYAKVVNKSGSTANVQVTLTYVALEA